MRVMAEDRRQVEQVVEGVTYRARNGWFDMPDRHARMHLAAGNLPSPNLAGQTGRRVGYRCPGCGFGSFFAACSRCGAECVKE